MSDKTQPMNRREFLRRFPPVLGGTMVFFNKIDQGIGWASDAGTQADTIFMNGKVATMDPAGTVAEAVAVKDDLILKIGSNQRMKDLGVVIGATPTFIRQTGDAWRAMLGDKRVERFMVTREWIDVNDERAMRFIHP